MIYQSAKSLSSIDDAILNNQADKEKLSLEINLLDKARNQNFVNHLDQRISNNVKILKINQIDIKSFGILVVDAHMHVHIATHRNNKTSAFVSYETLCNTMDYMADYANLYDQFRKEDALKELSLLRRAYSTDFLNFKIL